jgi:hypothetical protein
VTYPDAKVQELLNESLVPVKANFAESSKLKEQYGVVWTPTLVFLDGKGRAHHKVSPASLPPDEFIPVVLAGMGRTFLSQGHYDDAVIQFDRVVDRHPNSLAAPEALYWRGVAHYRKNDKDSLMKSWKELGAKHASSFWAKATTFLGR